MKIKDKNCHSCCNSLFHSSTNVKDSKQKKILKRIGRIIFNTVTLGIPFLIHYVVFHCFKPGVNTQRAPFGPQKLDDMVSGVRRTSDRRESQELYDSFEEAGFHQSKLSFMWTNSVSDLSDPTKTSESTGQEEPTQQTQQPNPSPKTTKPQGGMGGITNTMPQKATGKPTTDPSQAASGQPTTPTQTTDPQRTAGQPAGAPLQRAAGEPIGGAVGGAAPPPPPPPGWMQRRIPADRIVEGNSLEEMQKLFENGQAPRRAYKYIKLDDGNLEFQPEFTVTYPHLFSEFLSQEMPTVFSDQPQEGLREDVRVAIAEQAEYIDNNYLFCAVRGDGMCLYRSFATSWLLRLAQLSSERLDGTPFQEASAMILDNQRFPFNSASTGNLTLTRRIAQHLDNMSRNTSPRIIMDNYILNPEIMSDFLNYLQSMGSYMSTQARAQQRDFLLAQITGAPETIQGTFSLFQRTTEGRSALVNNLLRVNLRQNQNLANSMLSSTVSMLTSNSSSLNTSVPEAFLRVLIPLFNYINIFLQDEVHTQALEIIRTISQDAHYSPLWTRFISEGIIPTLNPIFQLYCFIEQHSLTNRDFANISNFRQEISALLNGLDIQGTLNIPIAELERIVTQVRTVFLLKQFFKLLNRRSELLSNSTPMCDIFQNIHLNLYPQCINEGLVRQVRNLRAAVSQVQDGTMRWREFFEEGEHSITLAPLPYLSQLYIFLSNYPSLLTSQPRNDLLNDFFITYQNNMTQALSNFTPDQRLLDSFVNILLDGLVCPTSIPREEEFANNHELTLNVIRKLEENLFSITHNPTARRLILQRNNLTVREAPNFQRQFHDVSQLIQQRFSATRELFTMSMSEDLRGFYSSLAPEYQLYIFLISSPSVLSIASTAPHSPIPAFLQCFDNQRLTPITREDQQRIELATNFSTENSRSLLQALVSDAPFYNLLIEPILQEGQAQAVEVLDRCYEATTRGAGVQAESEHVELLANNFIPAAICRFANSDRSISPQELQRLMITNGFLAGGVPNENQAEIFLMRFANHYSALIRRRPRH